MVWETSPVPFVNQTPSETLPCANGAACQEGSIVPLQSEASLGQSGGGWCRGGLTMWFRLFQDGSRELSSQRQAVNTAIRKSQAKPPKPSWGAFPRDTPLVMPSDPRAAQRGRQDSQGTSGQSPSPERQISGMLQGLTRKPPWASLAVNLVPLGIFPVCGHTSPGKRRLLPRRN